MPNDNRISAELSAAAVTAVRDAIAVIRTNLPFLVRASARTSGGRSPSWGTTGSRWTRTPTR